MVNLVAAHCSLLKWIMKNMAGLRPYTFEIHPGTLIRFWVPSHSISKPKLPSKPAVVLLHGFCGDGIMNWQLQVRALTKDYAVYVADLLFFGGSYTDKRERSPAFQAECLAAGLGKLGVENCVLVGFSYGGMVALKMGEMYPQLVRAMLISGAVVAVKEKDSSVILEILKGALKMLLPTSVEGVKALLSLGTHKNLCFPDIIHKHFLKVMFTNRKERGELLDALVNDYKDIKVPNFPQRIHLLWGENDKIFKVELAQNMKEELGTKVTFEGIKKAGHLVHMERPCVYNRCLKHFLSSIFTDN